MKMNLFTNINKKRKFAFTSSYKRKIKSTMASNMLFIFGGIIILAILFVIIFPEKLTHYNTYTIEGIKSGVQKNGSLVIKGAPFSPSKENLLGTDGLGRDLLSIIVYGTRYTMEICLFVVLGRFFIAIPMGVAAGVGNGFSNSVINLFNSVFSTIPSLLISVIVLKIAFFTNLFRTQSFLAFVIVLTIVGWAKLAGIIRERVQGILQQPFVTGEKAIGKSNRKIILENILPHFSPELTVLFFMEMSLALSMIMQLGFFGVYVGNIRVISSSDTNAVFNMSYEPEWASMLSSSINSFSFAPWTVLSPAAAFFISIFGFNIFGEGLREKLQSKNSMFIVYFRKILGFKILTKKVLKLSIALGCIVIVLVTTLSLRENNLRKTYTAKASELTNWQFKDQVLIGSQEADYTASNLKNSLKAAGFKPLGKDYIQDYDINKLYSIGSYEFTITNSHKTSKLILGKDFSLASPNNYKLSGDLFLEEGFDIFNLKDFSQFDNKFVVLDEQNYSKAAILNFSKELKAKSKALAIIDIIPTEEKLPETIYNGNTGEDFIYLTKAASLKLDKNSQLSITTKALSLAQTGKNVVGILPGNNPKLSKEAILISIGYNYLSYDKENTVNKLKMAIELAYKLGNTNSRPQRTIIISFFDGNLTEQASGAKYYGTNPLYLLENTVLDIDLTNMNTTGDTITFNTDQVPVSRYFAWAFDHELETNLKKGGLKVDKYINKNSMAQSSNTNPSSQEILYTKGVPTVTTITNENLPSEEKDAIKNKFIDILSDTIMKNKY
ncbi:ABC transporter permease subunit [Clostridium sp. C8-1-8]|uniref:ABC transporter permease subunit n=1 Tax=Clostridium sp. C8-1-8 TaxID=2698831 RepID=UPI00136C0404|nr:ABC transporter permease subunit [Clostridium sp. C8-1-8]